MYTTASGGLDDSERIVTGGVTVTKLLVDTRDTLPEHESRASRDTEYIPGTVNVCRGFCAGEVPPSLKFHTKASAPVEVLVNWTVWGATPDIGLPIKPADGCCGEQVGVTGVKFGGAGIFRVKVSDIHRSHCVPAINFIVKIPGFL